MPPGAFLDTTVVISLAEPAHATGPAARALVQAHSPVAAPYYAIRELAAGHVRYLCDVHNALVAAQNPAEAAIALLNRSPFEGRKRTARVEELMKLVDAAFKSNTGGARRRVNAEVRQALALKIFRLWSNARNLAGVKLTQPLACFKGGEIGEGEAGELRGPGGSFNCARSERCSAAGYIYDDKVQLTKLVDALNPLSLPQGVSAKRENASRRHALKELGRVGPRGFDKKRCRAIGDAYFAIMCPAGHVVATSNLSDFDPLCHALGKRAVKP